jgi:hypothetical protein
MPDRWVAGPHGLRLGRFLVSFQRYTRPRDGTVAQAPSSLGALPVARGAGQYCLPLGDQEAFWLGLLWEGRGAAPGFSVDATSANGCRAEVTGAQAGTGPVLLGPARPDGRFDALCPPRCVQLSLRFEAAATVLVTTPARYAALTGKPPPGELDPGSGYKGWRLP